LEPHQRGLQRTEQHPDAVHQGRRGRPEGALAVGQRARHQPRHGDPAATGLHGRHRVPGRGVRVSDAAWHQGAGRPEPEGEGRPGLCPGGALRVWQVLRDPHGDAVL